MNRKVMVAAVAAAFAAPAAFAQSSVTVGGTINIMYDTAKATGSLGNTSGVAGAAFDIKSHDRVRDGAGSNIRFSVIEDLGGGNSAFVQVEQAVIGNADTRANMFGAGAGTTGWGNRNSAVGIRSKQFGRFLIGIWDVHYHESYDIDPGWIIINSSGSTLGLMQGFGMPTLTPAIGGRYSNVLRWDSPVWSGFSVTANYARPTDTAPANAPGTATDGKKNRVWNMAARYQAGGLTVNYSYLSDRDAVTTNVTLSLGGSGSLVVPLAAAWKVNSNRMGARYKFAMGLGIGIMFDSSRVSNNTAAPASNVNIKRTVWAFPVTYETGNHHMYASYSRARDWKGAIGGFDVGAPQNTIVVGGQTNNLGSSTGAKNISVGYAYKLSQRTNAHVSYQKITNDALAGYDFFANSVGMGVANIGADPRTLAVGLRHTF